MRNGVNFLTEFVYRICYLCVLKILPVKTALNILIYNFNLCNRYRDGTILKILRPILIICVTQLIFLLYQSSILLSWSCTKSVLVSLLSSEDIIKHSSFIIVLDNLWMHPPLIYQEFINFIEFYKKKKPLFFVLLYCLSLFCFIHF